MRNIVYFPILTRESLHITNHTESIRVVMKSSERIREVTLSNQTQPTSGRKNSSCGIKGCGNQHQELRIPRPENNHKPNDRYDQNTLGSFKFVDNVLMCEPTLI